jgi:diguanylate cyclase (GGDEF)-like protein
MCVPIHVAGQARGVVHCVSEPDTTPDGEKLHVVEQLAARAGDRIGVLRAFARSQLQAETDPLTALLNRRSLSQQANNLWTTDQTISVAFGDLDNFKQLNDTHGHEAGDRALRLFARTLKESVRDADLVGRWGGEEFLVVFPGLDSTAGAAALERVRETLATRLGEGTVPWFTVSFGIVDTTQFAVFDDVVAAADEAMLVAKRQGRNRVVAGARPSTDRLTVGVDASS